MTSILWLEGSPKGDRSVSSRCARAFLDGVASTGPVEVTNRDLWSDDVLVFDREAALAKFGPLFGDDHTPEQTAIWDRVEAEIDLVRTHDHLLLSTPMWNWSVPHAVKNWLDVVVQPLASFTLDAEGRHVGVLGVGKSAHLLLTRSSAYDGRSPELVDHQLPYLTYVLEMIGFAPVTSTIVEPTTAWTPEEREALAERGAETARADGIAFGEQHRNLAAPD